MPHKGVLQEHDSATPYRYILGLSHPLYHHWDHHQNRRLTMMMMIIIILIINVTHPSEPVQRVERSNVR